MQQVKDEFNQHDANNDGEIDAIAASRNYAQEAGCKQRSLGAVPTSCGHSVSLAKTKRAQNDPGVQ